MGSIDHPGQEQPKFQIFRCSEISDCGKNSGTRPEGLTPVMEKGMERLYQAGLSDGVIVKSLFDAPGFGLNYVWLKSGFPLPLHAHDADCLYYIIAGTVSLGTETLGPGDGFFVPSNTPYTYAIGPDGVEALEIRHTQNINTTYMGKTEAYWSKLYDRLRANRDNWADEVPPQSVARDRAVAAQ
jgi:mannose-6-phosphate isomerase-like protein (cupin superfamily)